MEEASALQTTWDCNRETSARLTDAQWSVDSNNSPVITATFQGVNDPIQAIDKFMISPPDDWNLENAYYIYVIDPIFMNGYSSDMFNGTKGTYVGSNPHTMQIPYNPRSLPQSGTNVMISSGVYHGCHRDNEDSEIECTYCGWATFSDLFANSFFKIISRGRPPSEDVRKHFEKVTEVDGCGQKTSHQKCNYCGNGIIDLIDLLKDKLMKNVKVLNFILRSKVLNALKRVKTWDMEKCTIPYHKNASFA
ncbi:hypothetical protein C1646_758374 [Rhizophagus diaphanus]|nr:hypothetical protein C1646_758374 [Rhizophagus diaphanus] [Rhizophagus sp. MUCL 43196]